LPHQQCLLTRRLRSYPCGSPGSISHSDRRGYLPLWEAILSMCFILMLFHLFHNTQKSPREMSTFGDTNSNTPAEVPNRFHVADLKSSGFIKVHTGHTFNSDGRTSPVLSISKRLPSLVYRPNSYSDCARFARNRYVSSNFFFSKKPMT